MDPQGRIAVVTGAAGGIGSALVRGLIDAGAAGVIAVDLALGPLDDLARDVKAASPSAAGRVVPRSLDVTDARATQSLVEEIGETFGPVELWFANAGVSVGRAAGGGLEAFDAEWARQWDVNVMAHVHAARALLPGWLARGEGHLVTTASMAGLLGVLGDGVYAATKHAAVGFAEWLAITYGDKGIRVSCVCPGAVNTGMLRAGAGGDAVKAADAIGGGDVLEASMAAARILEGVLANRFLILTHPEMHAYVVRKAQDPERWIEGMQRLWRRTQDFFIGH